MFTDFKPIKKKLDVTLILSIIAKEKSDPIAKSEKCFWFLMTFIAFVIAYIISMMQNLPTLKTLASVSFFECLPACQNSKRLNNSFKLYSWSRTSQFDIKYYFVPKLENKNFPKHTVFIRKWCMKNTYLQDPKSKINP